MFKWGWSGLLVSLVFFVSGSSLAQITQDTASIEKNGQALYALEQAIVQANDAGERLRAFRRSKKLDDTLVGFEPDGSYRIVYIEERGRREPRALFQARVSAAGTVIEPMSAADQSVLTTEMLSQYNAMERALGQMRGTCSSQYAARVLPDADGSWRVYLLPRSSFDDVYMVGGAWLFVTSADGQIVRSSGELIPGCGVLQLEGQESVAFAAEPGTRMNEILVYTQLRIERPFFVTIDGVQSRIQNGRIQ